MFTVAKISSSPFEMMFAVRANKEPSLARCVVVLVDVDVADCVEVLVAEVVVVVVDVVSVTVMETVTVEVIVEVLVAEPRTALWLLLLWWSLLAFAVATGVRELVDEFVDKFVTFVAFVAFVAFVSFVAFCVAFVAVRGDVVVDVVAALLELASRSSSSRSSLPSKPPAGHKLLVDPFSAAVVNVEGGSLVLLWFVVELSWGCADALNVVVVRVVVMVVWIGLI